MSRFHSNWLDAYVQYTSFTEAPKHIHWWVGVSTIAAVLGRKVCIDQFSFKWYPNHYIFLVGPPDIISKTTTMNLGMRLLRKQPDWIMGPTSATWPALIKEMAEVHEEDFDLGDGLITKLCACTVASGELGNFLKPKDGEFLDVMIALWDGDTVDKKLIKDGGSVFVANPLLNLIGCTTPSWVSDNIPEHMLEGGLLSRVIIVYGDKIDHPVAYPGDAAPKDAIEQEDKLAEDLGEIAKMKGKFILLPETKAWGRDWYGEMKNASWEQDEKIRDRVTRKQTHAHKLAMILSAARGDSGMEIRLEDLQRAVLEIEKLSEYRSTVVRSVGKTMESTLADRLIAFVARKRTCKLEEAYRQVHTQLPNNTAFLEIVNGLVKAGFLKEQSLGGEVTLVSLRDKL